MSKRNNKGIGSNCNSNNIFHVNMIKVHIVVCNSNNIFHAT